MISSHTSVTHTINLTRASYERVTQNSSLGHPRSLWEVSSAPSDGYQLEIELIENFAYPFKSFIYPHTIVTEANQDSSQSASSIRGATYDGNLYECYTTSYLVPNNSYIAPNAQPIRAPFASLRQGSCLKQDLRNGSHLREGSLISEATNFLKFSSYGDISASQCAPVLGWRR